VYEVIGLKDGKEEILDSGIENSRAAQDAVDEYKLTYGNQYQQIWFRKEDS
jgi:hypothetical protein